MDRDTITALTVAVRVYRQLRQMGVYDVDRLTEKLQRAAGVVGRQSAKIEARADALIAREEAIEKRTDQVFRAHESIMATAERGIDGLEDKLRLLSNDPLPGSEDSQEAEQRPEEKPAVRLADLAKATPAVTANPLIDGSESALSEPANQSGAVDVAVK